LEQGKVVREQFKKKLGAQSNVFSRKRPEKPSKLRERLFRPALNARDGEWGIAAAMPYL
jgi:hypothetical protein